MNDTTLTNLRISCFIIGFIVAFLSISLQEFDIGDDILYILLGMIVLFCWMFFATAFIFIDTEKNEILQNKRNL